jgi:hypothetical protein
MLNLLFRAHGSKDAIWELLYALHAIRRHMPAGSVRIHIYTDQEALIRKYSPDQDISYHSMSPELVQAWRGEQDFVHRPKIWMMKELAQVLGEGKLIYLDSDMVCQASFADWEAQLQPLQFKMDQDEGSTYNSEVPLIRKMYPYLQKAVAKGLIPTADFRIWNSGIVGMDLSDHGILDQVLETTDLLYAFYPKHIMEQVSFSYWLPATGNVEAGSDRFFHYWVFKEWRHVIREIVELYPTHYPRIFDALLENRVLEILSTEKMQQKEMREQSLLTQMINRKWVCPPLSTILAMAGIQEEQIDIQRKFTG